MLASITVMFSLLIFITFVNDSWAQDSLEPWFLGSGLEPREGYYYTICDYEYHFDVSSDPCYDIMLSFECMCVEHFPKISQLRIFLDRIQKPKKMARKAFVLLIRHIFCLSNRQILFQT